QLIIFTLLAFVISLIVLISIERRLNKIVRFSSKLDSMILRQQFEPIRSADEDEISELTNNINNLISEFLKIQRETEENRNQLLGLTANLRKLNMELEYLKSFNESIINSIKISIIVLNENLEVIRFNPVAKNIFGVGEEVLNRRLFENFPSLDNERIRDAIKVALFERKMNLVEEQNFVSGDKQLIFDIIISPFVKEMGEVKGIIMMFEDRTEIIRTKRLLNQSERLATIGRMAAQLTHQIKNPLSTIGLNIEFIRDDLLENKIDTGDFIKKLNLIQSEIENLVRLSDEYLRFAKISNTKIEDIDINALLSSVVELYMPECKNKNVRIDFNLNEKVDRVRGDYNQLKQAIVNVLINAIESLSNGGVITISTNNVDGFVVIDISDDGRGIDEAVIKHIFDPFYSTKEGGSGLGLFIAG
ncbi:MAG: sensor histidine kinase, partial [Myxococcota bacterium]